MKKLIGLIAVVSYLVGCASGSSKQAPSVRPMQVPFQVRDFETQVLPNGLTLLWIADSTLPYVSLQMMIKAGSSQDGGGREGLAAFTASLLERGTAKRNAGQIAEDLEQIGSGFDVDVVPDFTIASASSLSFHRDSLLNLFQEILLSPSFAQNEIDLQRKISLAGFAKLADRSESFAEYLMAPFLYGQHPYGHQASGLPGAVKQFTRNDLKSFYGQHYFPSNAILAITGQFDDEWKKKLTQTFSSWEDKKERNREVGGFPQWKGVEILLVDRSDLNQAQIQVGSKGIERSIPEYIEYRAALKILGESFGSRLFDEIRVKRGLTYGINSYFDPRLMPGPMGISTFSRVDKAAETVKETLNTFRLFVKDGVTTEEVNTVRNLMRGQFPRTFETPEALARQLLILQRYGISPDYLKTYMSKLDGMSKDSVNAVIGKYFDADNLRILVYAPRKSVESGLRGLGQVQVKSYKEFLQ